MSEPASNQEDLKDFLVYFAENGYGNNSVGKTREQDGSDSIVVENNPWKAHDNYFTSEDGRRFHGRVVVSLGDRALWFYAYSGFVNEDVSPGEVYNFLKQAMLNPQKEFPIRGPWQYSDGNWSYVLKHESSDNLGKFTAKEEISVDGDKVYTGLFIGGDLN
jgi:hypothetical protein